MHPKQIQINMSADKIISNYLQPGATLESFSGSSQSLIRSNRTTKQTIEDIISSYVDPRTLGIFTKVAVDRSIKTYTRNKFPARNLVMSSRTDSDFYQWMVGGGVTAAPTAPGAQKRTVMFDLSSRYTRVYKVGLAVEFTDELLASMEPDLMGMVVKKIVDAFDELETSVILSGISKGVADGTNFKGIRFNSHVLNFNSPDYPSNRLSHDMIIDLVYILETEQSYRPTTCLMSSSSFNEWLKLDEWKDAAGKWKYVSSNKAMRIIEGATPGAPVLPHIGQIERLVISPLVGNEIIVYDHEEFAEFVERQPLTSEVPPHDAFKDISSLTFRARYGFAAKEPSAGVKGINVRGISLPQSKFA